MLLVDPYFLIPYYCFLRTPFKFIFLLFFFSFRIYFHRLLLYPFKNKVVCAYSCFIKFDIFNPFLYFLRAFLFIFLFFSSSLTRSLFSQYQILRFNQDYNLYNFPPFSSYFLLFFQTYIVLHSLRSFIFYY